MGAGSSPRLRRVPALGTGPDRRGRLDSGRRLARGLGPRVAHAPGDGPDSGDRVRRVRSPLTQRLSSRAFESISSGRLRHGPARAAGCASVSPRAAGARLNRHATMREAWLDCACYLPSVSQDVTAWLAGRRSVAEYEREEARRATTSQRLHALASLMASVDAMDLRHELEHGDDTIRARWNTLRQRLG